MTPKPNSKLLNYRRYMTRHDASTGRSAFSTVRPTEIDETLSPLGTAFVCDHSVQSIPVNLSPADEDRQDDANRPRNPADLLKTCRGAALCHIAIPPGTFIPMHKTDTLDYVVLIDGRLTLGLESGEERVLEPGDTVVQQGTMHSWRNTSETEVAIMVAFVMPATRTETSAT
ncbi:hypothetical protein MMYC01_201597 [Madurella mycetomatis]|uniref:Cupin type-2 domain-containing protein n=1 Tax=Madurella mycetomatis TaxID=100816 RepID=A0A175WCC4_9PEZI|nr:hypothetical protein MMYC01_201597 [Madurella mycetomatis]